MPDHSQGVRVSLNSSHTVSIDPSLGHDRRWRTAAPSYTSAQDCPSTGRALLVSICFKMWPASWDLEVLPIVPSSWNKKGCYSCQLMAKDCCIRQPSNAWYRQQTLMHFWWWHVHVFILNFRRLAHVLECGGLVSFPLWHIPKPLACQIALYIPSNSDGLVSINSTICHNTQLRYWLSLSYQLDKRGCVAEERVWTYVGPHDHVCGPWKSCLYAAQTRCLFEP